MEKQFDFKGKLDVNECTELVRCLQIKGRIKNKKEPSEEHQCARLWLEQAQRRKNGKKTKLESLVVERPEDQETGGRQRQNANRLPHGLPVRREKRESRQYPSAPPPYSDDTEEDNEPRGVVGGEMYPSLPPPSQDDMFNPHTSSGLKNKLRGGGDKFEWSKIMQGGLLKIDEENTDAYPLIEVANPAHDPNNNQSRPTIRVFRTWTQSDVKAAVEGVRSYKVNVVECGEDIVGLMNMYHLNGTEMQQVLMQIFGPNWMRIQGNWTPMAPPVGDARPLPLEADSAALQQAVEGVINRATQTFTRRADYGLIGQIKQKDGELVTDFRPRFEKVFRENSGERKGEVTKRTVKRFCSI